MHQAYAPTTLERSPHGALPADGLATIVRRFRIRRGLDVPVAGPPVQEIHEAAPVDEVALVGPDYVGMRPTMHVQPGDHVKLGQVLMTDKRNPGVKFTSPGCGRVAAVNRGQKRTLLSVAIRITGDACETFPSYAAGRLDTLAEADVRRTLIDSGLWTALRTRPFSKVPSPESTPASIFVTAIDTHPLAARPEVVLRGREEDFEAGLRVLGRLGPGIVFLCKAPETEIPFPRLPGLTLAEFAGPHPAGLPGTHIHFLDPVHRGKAVWHVGYQDVAAIGRLFLTGRVDPQRVVALAGPGVSQPRLLRTRLGANLSELVAGEMLAGPQRVVSGSVLAGRSAAEAVGYLGRYHQQVSLLPADPPRELFGWLAPGLGKYSLKRVNLSSLLPKRLFRFTTALSGGHRAIMPVGSYEHVMPLDILPTFLLRALAVDDLEEAEALGCLELDEEDLALCTFVCPGKNEFGAMLRRALTAIEREG